MLDFITTAAPEGASDMRVHKYPYVSCEIVCCDVPEVLDTLVEGRDGALLASLFRILGWEGGEGAGAAGGQEAGPLDPRLAGYFEKVFALLHQRKGLELVTFLNGGGIALFGRFAACLESYSVMEAVRRMLQPALLDSYDDQGGSFGDDGGFGFGGGGAGSGDEGSGADSFPTVCWQGDARVVGMLLEVLGAQGEDGDGSMTSAREHVAELLLLVVYNNSVTDGGGGMGGIDESFGDAGADGGGPKRTSPLLAAIASRDAAERIVRLALPDGKEGGAEMYSASSAMSSALAVLETLVSCCPMAVGSAAAGGAEGEEEKADEMGVGAGAAAAAAAAGEDAKDDGVITATVLDGDGGGGGAEEDAGPAPTAPVFDVIAERVGLIAQWLKGDVGAPRTMRHQDARETTTPCLGIGRLRVVELVVVLVQCRHAGVEAALVEHGVLPLCLDLFFAFPWSNMLHSLVEHVAIAVVEGGSEPLQLCLLRDGNLIARVVEAYAADEEQRKGAKKGRLGYMGHINRISNLVLASIEASERDIESSANNSGGLDESGAGSALDDSSMGFTGASVAAARFARLVQESEDKEQWNNFVESTLKEINCLENVPLGADGGGADDSVELPSGGAGGDDDGGSGSVFNLDALGRQLDSAGGGEGDGDDFAPRTFASNLSDVSGTAAPRLPAACLPAGLPALSVRPAAPRIVADAALLPAFLSARAGRLGPFVGIRALVRRRRPVLRQ